MYRPLIEYSDKESEIAYEKLRKEFQEILNPNKSVRLYENIAFSVSREGDLLKTALSLCHSFLIESGDIDNYKIYFKKSPITASVILKAKPANQEYQRKIIAKTMKKCEKSRSATARRSLIVKRTSDKNLAEWYQKIVSNAFVDYIVSVKQSGIMKFEVIIEVNINVNVN